MREALAKSKETGPNIQWLADRRTRLVEQHLEEVDEPTRLAYESDIAVMGAGELGVKILAQRYVRRPQLRNTYTSIFETLAPARQQAFFALVAGSADR